MTSYQPSGWPTVIPRIFAPNPEGLVEFLREVFGASCDIRPGVPAEVWIGGSVLMVSGVAEREPQSAFLYVYVEDADSSYQRAITAGATSLVEPMESPYGDRRAMVKDTWGNTWQIATRTVPVE